jgi:hypothetical protein
MTLEQREKAIAAWEAAEKVCDAASDALVDAEYDGDQSEIHDAKIELSRAKDARDKVLQRFPEVRYWPKTTDKQ